YGPWLDRGYIRSGSVYFCNQMQLDFSIPTDFNPGDYDPTLVVDQSRHYLAYIAAQQCVGCLGLGVRQRSRTTAHHIRNRGTGRKCPDFWAIPVEADRHMGLSGGESIDAMGKERWR